MDYLFVSVRFFEFELILLSCSSELFVRTVLRTVQISCSEIKWSLECSKEMFF